MTKHDQKSSFILSSTLAVVATALTFTLSACTESNAKAKPNLVNKPAPSAGAMAKIGDEIITEEALIGEEKAEFFELKKREHELRMDRLNKLIVDKLVGAEAKKANLSLEEYINKNVVKGEIKISEKEFEAFVAERRIPKEQLNPQIKERINDFLKTNKRQELVNAYVAKITKSNPVEVYFERPKMNIHVEIGKAPVWGNDKAPVKIIEFSDFQCPFCSRGAETVEALKKKYGKDKIQVAFKHFPLPMHKEAPAASEASMCMNEQSGDKFWKFHDVLFKNQDKLDNASLEAHAKTAGGDMTKFKECMAAGKYKQFVSDDLAQGEKVGVRSTPSFLINGELVAGALPIEEFSTVIDNALAEAKK